MILNFNSEIQKQQAEAETLTTSDTDLGGTEISRDTGNYT